MITTHAKPANPFSSAKYKGQTVNLGLKHPCQCGSEKKFKACCYAKPMVGWGWVLLTADRLELVTATPDEGDIPVVFAHSTYKDASEFAALMDIESQTGRQILIVRWELGDLNLQIANTFPRGTKIMVSCGPGTTLSDDTYVVGTTLGDADIHDGD